MSMLARKQLLEHAFVSGLVPYLLSWAILARCSREAERVATAAVISN